MEPSDTSLTERRHVQDRAARLAVEFTGTFNQQTIERLLAAAMERAGEGARVTTYVPLLAERSTRDHLRAAVKTQGAPLMTATPTVLFLCVHNAGRSQMAAGWMRHLAGDRVRVLSGGSAPAEQINPAAVEAMREVGIDITGQQPALWTDQTLEAADVIVTMGCGDACPVYPGKRYLDWELTDPAGKPVEAVRAIRDDIRERVRALLDELISAVLTAPTTLAR